MRPCPSLSLAAVVALLGLPGCARNSQPAADREVYRALAARRAHVPEVLGSLDVDAADAAAQPARAIADVRLDLRTALRLASRASREYLSRREDVYLKALAFTGAKHEFESKPVLGAVASTTEDPSSGTASATPSASVSRAFESGGSFVLKVATDFLKAFSGDPLTTARTILSADLVLPIARGSGTLVAREALTQAERDMLYELRAYARFQQTFAVAIATSFYRVAQARQTLSNEEASHASLTLVFERAKAFGDAGRLPDFEVDRARQDLLQADEARVVATQAYEASLDRLKADLGIPTRAKVTIEEGTLEALASAGLVPPALDRDGAVATALARRLDLENARDGRQDAERKVAVAADALGAQVNVSLGADLTGPARQPYDVTGAKPTGRTGLTLDLPVDRIAERNALRTARIQAYRARRSLEGLLDQVTAEVRDAWRTLEQAKASYGIQKEGLRLAERRVESANLSLQAGSATTRDVLDAEDDRIRAANALTTALVDYTIALLSYESAAGTLRPDQVAPRVGKPEEGGTPSPLAPSQPAAPAPK